MAVAVVEQQRDGAWISLRDCRVHPPMRVEGAGHGRRRPAAGGQRDGRCWTRPVAAPQEHRNRRRVVVGHREVGTVVSVEVGEVERIVVVQVRDRDRMAGQHDVGTLEHAALAVAVENRQRACVVVRHGQVEVVVAIQALGEDVDRRRADRELARRAETAMRQAGKYGHRIVASVGDRNVVERVGVELTAGHGDGLMPDADGSSY